MRLRPAALALTALAFQSPLSVRLPRPFDGGAGGGAGSGAGAGAGAGEGGGAKPFRSFATEAEYQAEINAAEARARQQAERKGAMSAQEREELDRLRQDAVDRQRKQQEAEGNYKAALESTKAEYDGKLASSQKTIADLLAELKTDRCRGQIIAATVGKVVPGASDQVARLLEDRVILDDDRHPVVLGANMKPWFIGGKPATAKDLVEEFLQTNQHFAVPAAAGTGAQGGQGAGDGDHGEAGADTDVAKAQKAYDDAFAAAQKTGLIADITKAQQLHVKLLEAKAAAKK